MQTIEKRHITYLASDCRRRHYHQRIGKWIIEFCIQLEIWHNDQWHPLLRYDTAHGFAHKDIISSNGEVKKTTLDDIRNFNEALTFAENDIKSNWELYREHFIKEAKND